MDLLLISYIVLAFYSLFLFSALIKGNRNNDLPTVYRELYTKKYAILLIIATLLVSPAHLFRTIYSTIPEKDYAVDVSVECDDGTIFSGKGTIYFAKEEEYYESGEDYNPIVGRTNGNQYNVYENYYLRKLSIEDSEDNLEVHFESSEPIEKNRLEATVLMEEETAGNGLSGLSDDAKAILARWAEANGIPSSSSKPAAEPTIREVKAKIIFPKLTDKTLGITMEDKMYAYSTGGYIEHIAIVVIAAIDLVLCFKAVSRKDDY